MSGIAGLLRFDGRPVTRHDIERAANALRQYGPDRSEIVVSESIGLVHVLMRMTPEDQFDRQPWRGASGSLITADVRLDNRDDVLARIGIPPREAMAWPDSRVLLAGWEKLGDNIWPMLRGPFAVAIWDPRSRTLTLARDHLGLNVVMWHRSDRFFAFATMPNGLFALDDVPRELSEEKLADFLVLNHADHVTTVYRNVFRVPPAHVMQVKSDGSITQGATGRAPASMCDCEGPRSQPPKGHAASAKYCRQAFPSLQAARESPGHVPAAVPKCARVSSITIVEPYIRRDQRPARASPPSAVELVFGRHAHQHVDEADALADDFGSMSLAWRIRRPFDVVPGRWPAVEA